MRRIVIAAMSTLSGLVLLFSYHTSTSSVAATASSAPVAGGASGAGPSPTSSGTASSSPTGSGATSSGTPSAGASRAASGTFTGDTVSTRWGDVQVQVTVSDGKMTKSEAIVYPQSNGRDQEINAYALPILAQESVAAQSANIDAVSGATVTSDGYTSSLQSALDQAHL